jgi:nicotinamidase-related amidase
MPLDLDNWPPTDSAIHLCIDMQNIFAPGGPWPTPWLPRVLPAVEEIAGRFPDRTVFTRFITPQRPEDMPGTWHRYYTKWREATLMTLNTPSGVGWPRTPVDTEDRAISASLS